MQRLNDEEAALKQLKWTSARTPQQLKDIQEWQDEIDAKREQIRMARLNKPEENTHLNNTTTTTPTPIEINTTQAPKRFTAKNPGKFKRLAKAKRYGEAFAREFGKQHGAKFKRAGRVVGERAINGAKTLGASAVKTAIKVPLAATMAVGGGIVAGSLTGDPSKVMQGAAAGGALGYGVSSTVLNAGGNVREVGHEAREAWHAEDEEWQKQKQDKEVKKIIKNSELRNTLSKKIGEDGLKDMETSGDLEKYVRNGVRDPEEMIALQSLQKEQNISSDAAIGTWQLHRDMAGGKDTTTMTGRDKVTKAMKEKYMREAANGNEDRAEMLTDTTMKYMDTYSKHLFHKK